ncbi:MAG: hypothetical protein M3R55_07415, partial [Acidobacteriota bacterium]|nr:hypothetical protein [Acidobacteriota bacterium]
PSPEKGEFVVVIPQGQTSADIVANAVGIPDDASICAEFGALTNNESLKPRAAAKKLAQKYGLATSYVYQLCAMQNK